MELPVRFPSDAEVIAADAARFRALSPAERVAELGEMYELYHFLARSSPHPERIAAYAEAEEEAGRRAVFAFAVRHA